MNISKRILVAFVLLLAALPVWAQSIGRVLVASGEVNIVRGSTTQPATAGVTLQVGDRVRTGAAGTAQIWFTDASVVALRNGSDFLIEQYSYNNGASSDSLVFNLVRGGFRTVAGLIGIQDRKAYVVKTKMATLGRRGTQYGILYCEQDCLLPTGGLAPDGLYGGVYDGRVGVANSTPEIQFGRDEYFYVASINSIPQPLLGPPSFFADRLAGLAKNAQKPASEPPASQDKTDVAAEDGAASSTTSASAFVVTENRNASGNPAVSPGTFSGDTNLVMGYTVPLGGNQSSPFNGAAVSAGGSFRASGQGNSLVLTSFDLRPGAQLQGNVGSSGTDMQGIDSSSQIRWGRWINGSVTQGAPISNPGTYTPGTGFHYLIGTAPDNTVLAAKTGSFTFTDIGGTTPTSSSGEVASSFNIGSLLIDFTARTGQLSTLTAQFINAQFSFSNVAFTFTPNPNSSGGPFINGFSSSGSCSGSACGGSSQSGLTVAGSFFGPTVGNVGLSLSWHAVQSNAWYLATRLFGNPQPFVSPPLTLLFANSLIEANGSRASYGGVLHGPSSNLTLSGSGPTQTLTAFNVPSATFSGAVGNSGIDGAGYDALSGVYYGRWINGTITSGSQQAPALPAGTQTSGMGVHYMYGTPTPDNIIASKTGSAQYVDYVGTHPTASNGESASSFNIGPININFTTRTGEIDSVQVQFPTSQWFFSSLPFNISVTPGQGASFDANLINVGHCSGSGCGPVQGSGTARADFFGRFIGSSGNFIGLVFQGNSGGNTPSGNPNLTMGMVRLFKCPSCP